MRKRPGDRVRFWCSSLGRVLSGIVATATIVMPVSMASATSSSTSTWSLAAASTSRVQWNTVAFVGGLFVALGHARDVATSHMGTQWTLHAVPDGSWSSVAFGNGQFIALSSSNTGPRELRSTNGVDWVAANGPAGTWTGVTFGAGRFVAVGSDGRITTSTAGVNWRTTWVHSKFDFTSIAYGNGRFIAVDQRQGDDLVSLDGLGWSFYPITTAGQRWSGVAFGDGNFVAFDNSRRNVVASTVLGYTWTPHVHAQAQIINAATYGCDTFVALGGTTAASGFFFTSPTGASWTSGELPVVSLARWTSVAYGSSRFVAVDVAGHIASMRAAGDCSRAAPTAPRDVSGNVPSSGRVWTYMHPPVSAGSAAIDGYLVSVTDGTTTTTCRAAVFYQPNCVVAGLHDRRIYYVTTQAHNRYGYSVASDPQWVIPVASWDFVAGTPTPVVSAASPVLVEVTGVRANSRGIYPESEMTIHFGDRLFYCQPSWFGECYVRVRGAQPGRTAIYATYVGYGHPYRTPTSYVTVVP